MGSEEMKHKTSAEYVTLLSFFDSTPSDLKKILQEQPIQHTDDNESRSLIFPTTVDSRLADTSLLRPPDNADNNQPSPPPPLTGETHKDRRIARNWGQRGAGACVSFTFPVL